MGLTPTFSDGDVNEAFNGFRLSTEEKVFEILKYAGEGFVTAARNLRTYKDKTGNLRSSLGFTIAYDGAIIEENIQGDPVGVAAAKDTVEEVLAQGDKGFVLIGVAGMQYAGHVESRGFNVITSESIEAQKILRRLIRQALK